MTDTNNVKINIESNESTKVNNDNNSTNSSNKSNDDDSTFDLSTQPELPVIINTNAPTLQTLDNNKIKIFEGKEEEFIKILRSIPELTEQQIRIIEVRYVAMIIDYKKRVKKYDYFHHFTRLIISLGGVAVPALLSIQSPGQVNSVSLYWFTWIVSLTVTVLQNLSNIFRFDKKYYGLHSTVEKLNREGWQYLELSGRYSTHDSHPISTHANQFLHFVNTIEKIQDKQMQEEYNSVSEKPKKVFKPTLANSVVESPK
jgi:hypothetical protein